MILGAKPQVVVCTLLNDVTPQDNRPPIPSPMDRPGAEHNHLRSYLTATEPSATIVHQIPLKLANQRPVPTSTHGGEGIAPKNERMADSVS
uniref:Uncharacterized protein n=1 Tax=Timema douglasi TaxID=61478 RepID=A0A7R8VWK7_TIMDO|nr:unnamed protein product [Timema douglasi]